MLSKVVQTAQTTLTTNSASTNNSNNNGNNNKISPNLVVSRLTSAVSSLLTFPLVFLRKFPLLRRFLFYVAVSIGIAFTSMYLLASLNKKLVKNHLGKFIRHHPLYHHNRKNVNNNSTENSSSSSSLPVPSLLQVQYKVARISYVLLKYFVPNLDVSSSIYSSSAANHHHHKHHHHRHHHDHKNSNVVSNEEENQESNESNNNKLMTKSTSSFLYSEDEYEHTSQSQEEENDDDDEENSNDEEEEEEEEESSCDSSSSSSATSPTATPTSQQIDLASLPWTEREKLLPPETDESLPLFILLVGIPGAGKSTWCDQLEKRILMKEKEHQQQQHENNSTNNNVLSLIKNKLMMIHSDDVRKDMTGNVNDQTQNDAVWEEILQRVQQSLGSGVHTMLDATNVDTFQRRSFLKNLPLCRLRIQIFPIPKTTAKNRIAKDLKERKERSAVPEKIVDMMFKKYQESMITIANEGWRLFDEEKFLEELKK